MGIEFFVSRTTYNSYGPSMTFGEIGYFLEMNCPKFGTAIKEIEIHVHFSSKPGTKPKRTLEGHFEKFHQALDKLLKCKFFRKKQRFILNFQSNAGYANDPHVDGYGSPDLKLFHAVLKEVITHFKMLTSRIKPTDDFQLNAFLNWLDAQIEVMPKNQEELIEFAKQADDYRKIKYSDMDEWEKLGVDWSDYAPTAREILNEPFYWDCGDDFAPHGNDSGADLLSEFEEHRNSRKEITSEVFLQSLWQSWWGSEVSFDSVTTQHPNDHAISDYDKLTVALAFAHIKYEAKCPKWIHQKALESINRQRDFSIKEYTNWEHLEEYLTKTNKIETILKNISLN